MVEEYGVDEIDDIIANTSNSKKVVTKLQSSLEQKGPATQRKGRTG